jgi:N-acetylglucosaminyldiphosphoundecaprenol N-acetyl-beta-D-mannosaminyltransferase
MNSVAVAERIALRGLSIDPLTEQQAAEQLFGELGAGRGGVVLTPNLDHLRRHAKQPAVRPAYRKADLVLADGTPLVWASRVQGTPLPERVPGSDLIWTIAEGAAQRSKSVFLLGGAPETVAPAAAERLLERFPKLRIAGCHCPPFEFLTDQAQQRTIRDRVHGAGPDIVFVGLPSPIAELVIEQLRPLLPGTWFLGLGASLSFVSGDVRRAPGWTHRIGLEWLWRLRQEPRLARRYLLDCLPFAFSLMGSAVLRRWYPNRPVLGELQVSRRWVDGTRG